MEISDEYIDSSTINKSKLEDTSKIKSGQCHFLFLFIKLREFLTCNGGGTTHPFSYLNVAELHLPALFHMKLAK